jgi:hypothetical protein
MAWREKRVSIILYTVTKTIDAIALFHVGPWTYALGSPPETFWNNFQFRYPISSELVYTEDGKVPESWRKTPISSEKLDIENAKLLEQSVAYGIIQ